MNPLDTVPLTYLEINNFDEQANPTDHDSMINFGPKSFKEILCQPTAVVETVEGAVFVCMGLLRSKYRDSPWFKHTQSPS